MHYLKATLLLVSQVTAVALAASARLLLQEPSLVPFLNANGPSPLNFAPPLPEGPLEVTLARSNPPPPILIDSPLATSTQPPVLPCPPVDNANVNPRTLMPDDGTWKQVFSVVGTGTRNYSCGLNYIALNAASVSVSSFFPGSNNDKYRLQGRAYYNTDNLPQLDFTNPDGSHLGTIISDAQRVDYPQLGESLRWRRWPLLLISGGLPWAQYISMTETRGGAEPTSAECDGNEWIAVPYSALYTYWTC